MSGLIPINKKQFDEIGTLITGFIFGIIFIYLVPFFIRSWSAEKIQEKRDAIGLYLPDDDNTFKVKYYGLIGLLLVLSHIGIFAYEVSNKLESNFTMIAYFVSIAISIIMLISYFISTSKDRHNIKTIYKFLDSTKVKNIVKSQMPNEEKAKQLFDVIPVNIDIEYKKTLVRAIEIELSAHGVYEEINPESSETSEKQKVITTKKAFNPDIWGVFISFALIGALFLPLGTFIIEGEIIIKNTTNSTSELFYIPLIALMLVSVVLFGMNKNGKALKILNLIIFAIVGFINFLFLGDHIANAGKYNGELSYGTFLFLPLAILLLIYTFKSKKI